MQTLFIKYFLESGYDLVEWIDCDVVINRYDIDINQDFINTECIQSLVPHVDMYEGIVPNTGVWSLKRDALPLIDQIWNLEEFIDHKWWEQGALIHLMNNNNEYKSRTFILPYEFNVHKNDIRFKEKDWIKQGVMLHATTWQDRKKIMTEWSLHNHDYFS